MPFQLPTGQSNNEDDENNDKRELLSSEEPIAIEDVANPPSNFLPDPGGFSDEDEEGSEDDEDGEEKISVSYFSLYRYATRGEIFLIILGVLASLLTGVLPAIGNYTFGLVTTTMVAYASNSSRVCPPQPSNSSNSLTSPFMEEVEMFVIYQSAIGLAEFIFGYLFVMSLNVVAEKQVFKIRKLYFRKLLQQEIPYFDKNSKRDFSSRMVEDMLKIQDSLSEKSGMMISNFLSIAFLLGLSFWQGWKLTLAMLAFLPVLTLTTILETRWQTELSQEESNSYAEAGSVAEEVFTNIQTVHAFNAQEKEKSRYNLKIDTARKTATKRHFLAALGDGLDWFAILANWAYAFWYGAVLVVQSRERGDGEYTAGNVFVILFSVMMAGFHFGESSEYIEGISEGSAAASTIFPVLDRESEINSASEDGITLMDRPRGEIEFNNVSFSYPTRENVQILNKVNLGIKPGQTVALVGASGCGKSTCVQLLQRLYDVKEGEIKLDGVDLRRFNVKWLRSQFGVVGQEPVLFNTTISKNITFGLNEEVSQEKIEEAARMAYAHNFIMQLPQGYDTLVGERGTSLSGGQKQRIAIARALVRNPSVLLLDEATSALDYQSESIVQAALEQARKGRSTLIIAHRLSTIKAADLIYVINEGKVAEEGTHSSLMELKGKYYDLVQSQENDESDNEFLKETGSCEENEPEMELSLISGKKQRPKPIRLISHSSSVDYPCRPSSSPRRKSFQRTESVEEDEEENKEALSALSLFRLLKSNLKEWHLLLTAFICSIITGLQMPLYAYISGEYIQSFTSKDDFLVIESGTYYCFAYLIIATVISLSSATKIFLIGLAGERFTFRIRKLLFSSLIEQSLSFFSNFKNTVGKLTARLSTDATSMRGATGARVASVLQAFCVLLAAAGMSFYYLPSMAALTGLFVPLMIYVSFSEGKVMGTENVIERDSIEHSCNIAVEALNNIRTVAGLGAEDQVLKMYEEELQKAHKINLKRAHVRGLVYGFCNGAPMICYCLSLWYGGYLVQEKCARIADVFKVAEALIYCTMSGSAAVTFSPDYQKGKLAAARIFKLLDVRPLINRFTPNVTLGTVKGQVDFKDVNFHYENRPLVKVLKDFSLNVNAGESVGICGPSGSGKSTCAALIFRFYDPDSGQVKFDGFDLRNINLEFLRQQISLVSQEPVLFDCSIKENIAYGDNSREVDMSEIINASKATNMHNFITSLPAGYETRVGMLGNQMSGGQKQRIAISRAIIRNPKLLVLDEATSALDSESEVVVQTALDSAKTGKTSITIAHRLSSIINSDKIFVIKNGVIEESGTHSVLLQKGGLYQAMWNAQSSSIK